MKNRNYIIFGSLIIIIIILLWLGSWYYIDVTFPDNSCDYLSNRGTFGDKFGFINSLFSGLALTGIVISIYFQQIELKLQRNEIVETRKEFKDQNFQTTFFNLLKTQRQLAEEINCNIYYLRGYSKESNNNIEGRSFFIVAKSEMKKIKKALDNDKFLTYTKWEDILEYYSNDYEPQSNEEALELSQSKQLEFTFYNYNIKKDLFFEYKESTDLKKAEIIYTNYFLKNIGL